MLDAAKDGSVSGAVIAVPAAGIRPFTVDDIPAVAHLFRRTFVKKGRRGTRSLEDQLRREFFEHPWRDPKVPSLVFADPDGTVSGFIGVRPLRLRHNEVPVLAAVGGSLMVEEPAKHPLTGARLLRSYLAGGQDISLSESANEVSQPMWDKVGGHTEPAYSMEWLRVFRPGGMAVAIAEERNVAARLLRPFAAAFDWCTARLRRNPLRLPQDAGRGADVDDEALADAVLHLSRSYALRPDWDRASLLWFLSGVSEKERFGPLVRRIVRDRKGETVGAYLYCVRPGGVGLVLQVLATEKAAEEVVDDLLADAFGRGAVAVRGRVQPELADVLLRRRAVFLHASSMVVHSRRAELMSTIRAGRALITGLACESWSGLIGGLFI